MRSPVKSSPNHPKAKWHPAPFAWFPYKINETEYWLERPPYLRRGKWYEGIFSGGWWLWEYKPYLFGCNGGDDQ